MTVRHLIIGIAFLTLAACATTAPTWNHSQLIGAEADRQFSIAHGQCTREAYTAVSTPQVHQRTPQPQSYDISGKVHTSAGTAPPTTTLYNARVEPRFGPLQAMQYVQEAGDAGAARGAAQYAQRQIYLGCMAAQGWTQAQDP